VPPLATAPTPSPTQSSPLFVAAGAASAAVLLVLAVMFAATCWYGKGTGPAVAPVSPKAAVPAPAPQPEAAEAPFDPAQQREFNQLLTQANTFEADPSAGCKAWTDFLIKYQILSKSTRTIAEERLQLYQTLKARNTLDIRPRQDEPEF
jgi:hypothetical protein